MANRSFAMIAPDAWREKGVPVRYRCGWCDIGVSSIIGIDFHVGSGPVGYVRLCSDCGYPSFIDTDGTATPEVPYGDAIADLPSELAGLYVEARDCVSIGANHAAVMVARKILMHTAVVKGAPVGKGFVEYVDYLVAENLVPPETKDWVDEIRQVGNDATHEIFDIGPDEAKATVDFVAMLLRLLYEYPAKGARSVAARAAKDASK